MSRKPTILHIIGSDFLGSPEKLILGQMKHLHQYRFVCASFVRPGAESGILNAAEDAGLQTEPITERSLFDSAIPGRIRAIVARHNIALIVSHGYKANFYSYLARKKLDIPQIGYFHGWTAENLRIKLYNLIDKAVLKRLPRVIAVSGASADRLASHGIRRDRIEVVYNVLEFNPAQPPPDREFHNPVRIGVVGRLSHEKGVHVFLKALAEVKRELSPIRAEIYGDGLELERLKQQTAELKLQDIVSFEGFRTDMDNVYARLDLLVIPSLSEGHPLVVLEAWRHGLGIVATRAGGIPEVIEDGVTGMLVDIDRPDQLGKAIKQAVADPDMMLKYGRAGYNDLVQKYNYNVQSARLTEIYDSLIGLQERDNNDRTVDSDTGSI